MGEDKQGLAPLIKLDHVNAYYGKIHVLKGVTLEVFPGEITTLIGSNGAGKSTTLKAICGLVPPRAGEIYFRERRIDRLPPHEILAAGVALVPEGRQVFAKLTVAENLEMGAYTRNDPQEKQKDLEWVYTVFPVIKDRRRQLAGTLSGGEQQMLAMARGLMSHPQVLLLDEPSMGLAPILVDTIFEFIRAINDQGTTVLLVEQNAHAALAVADRGYVMQTGEIALADKAARLRENETVRKLYLGES